MSENEALELVSTAFADGERIPTEHTCDGEGRSPELAWRGAPAGVESWALIVDDPDAPDGTFVHWILFDIPSFVAHLEEGVQRMGLSGENDFGADGWGGPCPPEGHGEHRYRFRLYALDLATLDLPPGAKRAQLEERMRDHVLAQAELTGLYERSS